MRIAAWLTYNGAPFSGFARQNDQLTVQGSIEEALELLFHRQIETTCAGRTDAGVHALCQVISFDLFDDEWFRRKPETLLRSLNALTHEAIAFRSVRPMPKDFSARFSALSREYRYYLCTDDAPPLLMEAFSWHLGKTLDVEAMQEAASFLVGEHDFKSFCMAVSAKGKPTNRFVASIDFTREQIWNSNFIVMTVVGNAFLHSMVRTMVGTLVLVGLGKREPEWVKSVLAARNRQAAGQNAPAQGLVLWNVDYEEEHFFFDPRPSQLRGSLLIDQSLSDSIEEIAEVSPKPKKDKKQEKSGKKKQKKLAERGADSPWARRRQDKEWARDFAIPRGSIRAQSDAEEPIHWPTTVYSAQQAQTVEASAQVDETVKTKLETEIPVIPSASDISKASPAPNGFDTSDAPNKPSISAGIPTELYAMRSWSETPSKPSETSVAEESTTADSESPKDPKSSPASQSTVLSAAGARARRRAREAAER